MIILPLAVIKAALPWLIPSIIGAAGLGAGAIQAHKGRKEAKAQSAKMESAMGRKSASAGKSAMGTNEGAIGKVKRTGGARTMMGGAGGYGGTGAGKGLLS